MPPKSVRLASTIFIDSDIFAGCSVTAESAATLIHAFVTSCVDLLDYCNVILGEAPKVITNKLKRAVNAAARVLTGTRKFDRGLTQLTISTGLMCLSALSIKSSS